MEVAVLALAEDRVARVALVDEAHPLVHAPRARVEVVHVEPDPLEAQAPNPNASSARSMSVPRPRPRSSARPMEIPSPALPLFRSRSNSPMVPIGRSSASRQATKWYPSLPWFATARSNQSSSMATDIGARIPSVAGRRVVVEPGNEQRDVRALRRPEVHGAVGDHRDGPVPPGNHGHLRWLRRTPHRPESTRRPSPGAARAPRARRPRAGTATAPRDRTAASATGGRGSRRRRRAGAPPRGRAPAPWRR